MTTEQIEMVADKLYAAYEGILSRLEELRVKYNEEFAKFSNEDLALVNPFRCWEEIERREKLAFNNLSQYYTENAIIRFCLGHIELGFTTRTRGRLFFLRTDKSWIVKENIIALGIGSYAGDSYADFVERHWKLNSDAIFVVKHLAEEDWTPFYDWVAGVMSEHLTAVSNAIAEAHRKKDEAIYSLLTEFGLTDGGARHIRYRYSFKREEV